MTMVFDEREQLLAYHCRFDRMKDVQRLRAEHPELCEPARAQNIREFGRKLFGIDLGEAASARMEYVLTPDGQAAPADWASFVIWMEVSSRWNWRRIESDRICGLYISTVFIGLDHDLPDHPKLQACSFRARWLFIEALCYSDRLGTGGKLTPKAWQKCDGFTPKTYRELREVGLVEEDGSIHDWSDFGETEEQAKTRREASRLSSARSRHKARYGHFPTQGWKREGDPCVLCSAGHGDKSRDDHKDVTVTGLLPTPSPTPLSDSSRPLKSPFEGPEAQRSEELMEALELNAATRARIRRCGLAPGRIYAILRDTHDARPKRPGGYAWKLVTRELEGKV